MVDLAGVRWIGGGSGAGKSTVASRLGDRFGLPVVQTDLTLDPHAEAMADDPRVGAFVRMSMDERWVEREPGEMLRTFPWFAGAGFDLLLGELPGEPVLVEGFRLLPRLVAPLLGHGGRAVWLLPTPELRAAALGGRAAEGRAFWERTSDPARALRNLLERDRLFTELTRAECADLGLPTIDVDGSEPVDVVVGEVAALLGLEPVG